MNKKESVQNMSSEEFDNVRRELLKHYFYTFDGLRSKMILSSDDDLVEDYNKNKPNTKKRTIREMLEDNKMVCLPEQRVTIQLHKDDKCVDVVIAEPLKFDVVDVGNEEPEVHVNLTLVADACVLDKLIDSVVLNTNLFDKGVFKLTLN